jgi:predicted acyltransferase
MDPTLVEARKKALTDPIAGSASKRLLSLDFFRGITMFFLIGTVYEMMRESDNGILYSIGWQFEHRYWHGMTLYDLIEPFFMFIVGVAIPFSIMSRRERGESDKKIFRHVLQRCVILFFLGILTYSVGEGRPVFRLWSVLTQLSFTYLLAFLLMRKPVKVQIAVSLLLLVVTDLLYRFWSVDGFNQPYVPGHNFGTWFDMNTMGVTEHDHWVAFNFLPTSAFTIWGVLAGLLLRSDRTWQQKIKVMLIAGITGIVLGLALDPVVPMIKRIATSSIVLETGGWCFVALAFSYWLVDIKKVQRIPLFFAIVGMNPLVIYFFDQVGGTSFLSRIARPFGYGLFFWAGEETIAYATALITWFLLWYICYWLYKRRIFVKV